MIFVLQTTKDFNKSIDKEDRKKQLEFLRQEKAYIMSNMEVFKRNVTDIEAQEEDINREVIITTFIENIIIHL